MLWIIFVSEDSSSNSSEFSKEFLKNCCGLMKSIVETVYSPVGFLQSTMGIVLAYDLGTLEIDLDGINIS